jgi:D-serine deaminase-like pyridoxal phosphate-dependent protein
MTSVDAALDTPALVVDLDIMESNIARIAAACRESSVRWRPHIKGLKTPEIVRKALAAGAFGITCAKLGEAEIMAAAGIRNILIANQIVAPVKIARLVTLLDKAEPIVAVDSITNIDALSEAMSHSDRVLPLVIEVDLGMKRAGVAPGPPVLALANAIADRRALKLRGVMGWESHAIRIADRAEKERTVAAAIGLLTSSARACREAGHSIDIVSCGGTGTFPWCIRQSGVTEVQIGGGIFSDRIYREEFHVDFPSALTVLATVTSRPTATRIIVDAGKKALSCDAMLPEPIGIPPVKDMRFSAEHATIELESPNPQPQIGDRIAFIAGSSDTTVNLHDEIIAMRGGEVEAVWPIAARGKSR